MAGKQFVRIMGEQKDFDRWERGQKSLATPPQQLQMLTAHGEMYQGKWSTIRGIPGTVGRFVGGYVNSLG